MTPSSQRTAPHPHVPPKTRVYAIGDVHGRRDLLDRLLADIARDAAAFDERKVLVLLGDLIDRGPDSKGTLERARQLLAGELLDGFEVHVLKGNHEDMMMMFCGGKEGGSTWRSNGGDATMLSYGIDPDQDDERVRQDLLAALEGGPFDLVDAMEINHREGDYLFVHAGIRPGVALDAQSEADQLWIRAAFIESDADFGPIVVHGHTPRPAPEVKANRIGIDTRAWASGELTCLVLEGERRRFIAT